MRVGRTTRVQQHVSDAGLALARRTVKVRCSLRFFLAHSGDRFLSNSLYCETGFPTGFELGFGEVECCKPFLCSLLWLAMAS